jgi:hypothetical protein
MSNNRRPETVGNVRPAVFTDATTVRPATASAGGPRREQKTVRCLLGVVEAVLLVHNRDGWSFVNSIPVEGGEILLIFER